MCFSRETGVGALSNAQRLLPRECFVMERFSQKEIKGIIHHWHLQCILQGLDTVSEGANTSPTQSCSWILNQMWLEISSIRARVYLRSGFGPGPWAMLGLNLCSGSQCSWYSEHKFSVSVRFVVNCKYRDKRKRGTWFRTHRNRLFPKKHMHMLDRALWNCYLPLNQKNGIYWDEQVPRLRFAKEPEVTQITFTFSRSWEPQSLESL